MTQLLQTMVSFLNKGGPFMWPLLLCSIVTVATIILAALTLRQKKVLPLVIESEIERLIPGGSAERLVRIVNDDNSSLAGVVRTALQHLRWPRLHRFDIFRTRIDRPRSRDGNCAVDRIDRDRLGSGPRFFRTRFEHRRV